jgi:hypothetical protein
VTSNTRFSGGSLAQGNGASWRRGFQLWWLLFAYFQSTATNHVIC